MSMEDTQARKIRAREEAIARLQAEAKDRGQVADRAFWSMVYDFEVAPVTTNRAQLAELGIEVPPSETMADDELSITLKDVCEGLGRLHVYLLHTDHLSDRELYERLERDILEEEVRELPAIDSVREYVDLIGTGSEEDTEVFDRYYADHKAQPLPYDRDRHLPRPPDDLPF